ncbi:hypothetical protein [Virgibacillus doumboii]|uniref:hypothetical protein n=1 Tax=Virgibacillus doumboii TaxID=2697503 RepID=UPI0013DFE384|nr:hypothetical protein [Virgibacillus doumboii]
MDSKKSLLILLLLVWLFVGCAADNTGDWNEEFRFTGTVEEILVEKEILIMKEYNAPESRKNGNIYEISAENIEDYEIGEKFLVIVESNVDEDVWDLDHMRFKIKPVED